LSYRRMVNYLFLLGWFIFIIFIIFSSSFRWCSERDLHQCLPRWRR